MTEGWHVGRKNIVKYFFKLGFLRSDKITAWRSVQRWSKCNAIILHHDSYNRPFVIEDEVEKTKLKQAKLVADKKLSSL